MNPGQSKHIATSLSSNSYYGLCGYSTKALSNQRHFHSAQAIVAEPARHVRSTTQQEKTPIANTRTLQSAIAVRMLQSNGQASEVFQCCVLIQISLHVHLHKSHQAQVQSWLECGESQRSTVNHPRVRGLRFSGVLISKSCETLLLGLLIFLW